VRARAAALQSAEGAQIAAWNSRDLDAVRAVYSDDIVHHDGQPLFVGIEAVLAMVREMYRQFPELGGRLGGVYIGREDGFGVWEWWGVFRFTEDSPGVEYDLLETRDGRISYWTLFYDPDLLNRSGSPRLNLKLLEDYTAAWSSADPETVVRLYAEDAVREDTVLQERQEGQAAIRTFAASFFGAFPGAVCELLEPFGESAPGIRLGGVYAFHVTDELDQPCAVRMLVLLEPSEGVIVNERVFYDAESLVSCSWAR
jgi:ketosteroid isomerase-like protein